MSKKYYPIYEADDFVAPVCYVHASNVGAALDAVREVTINPAASEPEAEHPEGVVDGDILEGA